jgi:putative selenium metabolism hydrolase
MGQIRNLPAVKTAGADVALYTYDRPSYTGLVYPADAYFPTWLIERDHPVCSTLADAFKGLFNKEPVIDKWTFSTNGVSIMGRYGIPCIGFGPGHEDQSHAPNEKTWKKELIHSAAMYSVIPDVYLRQYADRMAGHTEKSVTLRGRGDPLEP